MLSFVGSPAALSNDELTRLKLLSETFLAQQRSGNPSVPTVPQAIQTAQQGVPTAQQQAVINQSPAVPSAQQTATVSTDIQTILAGHANSDQISLQVHPDGTVTTVPTLQPQGSAAFSLASLGINPEVLLPQMPPGVSAAALNGASLEAIQALAELGKFA